MNKIVGEATGNKRRVRLIILACVICSCCQIKSLREDLNWGFLIKELMTSFLSWILIEAIPAELQRYLLLPLYDRSAEEELL